MLINFDFFNLLRLNKYFNVAHIYPFHYVESDFIDPFHYAFETIIMRCSTFNLSNTKKDQFV